MDYTTLERFAVLVYRSQGSTKNRDICIALTNMCYEKILNSGIEMPPCFDDHYSRYNYAMRYNYSNRTIASYVCLYSALMFNGLQAWVVESSQYNFAETIHESVLIFSGLFDEELYSKIKFQQPTMHDRLIAREEAVHTVHALLSSLCGTV